MQNLIIKPMIGVINGWVLPLIMKAMTLMEGQFFSQNIETADHSYYPQDLTANAIPMPPQDAFSGATRGNGYSLFDCCNAGLIFEVAPRRARQLAPICVVIKSLCRITILQFYA